MSAQQRQSSSSSSSKSTSGNSSENATGSGGAGSYSLATASPGTPPTPAPRPPKVKKPKKKKTAVGDASVMGAAPNTNDGPPADTAAPTTTGGGAGAAKGPASEAGKASKDITSKKPSQFLTAYKGMGKAVTSAKQKDEQTAHNAIPQFHAVMPSDAQAEQDNKDKDAKADKRVDDKGEGPEAQAKTGKDKKAKKAKRQKVDGKAKSDLKKYENMLEALQNIFGSVVGGINTDSQVNTSPGPAPEIEFSGESNPVRADKAHKSADTKINEGHEEFAKAIDEGKQPSDVKRQEMDEVHDLIKNPDPTIGEESVAAGQKYFEQLMAQHQSQEIDAADPLFHDRVQTQMAEANKQMDSTLEKQETERQEAVANLEKDIDAKNKEAKDKQEEIVAKEKGKIAEAQKETRKKQDKEVKKAKRKGDKERRKVEKDIDKREKDDEKKIKTKYKEADEKADGEKKKAHSKAAKKKQEAKKKQKKKSWWDRVKSAVSDFVDSVCSVIGDIFDALGKLVSGILNAVKKLAASVIDAAIKWAKKALDSLGGFMKGLVNGLIGDIFPGAAKWLNDKIDSGINLAKKGVEKVGDDLKKGVEAAVDGVNKTVQKGLQVAKTGMQTAVRVAGKVATGDFEGAFLETLYGALGIAGVSRGDADKMLGNARDTLKSVVDAPGAFVGNLAKAGKDGFMSFGKNFLKHFTGAVTTWLLGPVAAAGLKAPEKWDAQGIFTMVLGVMGVSKESLMGMAEERIGKKNMGALQKAFDYVTSFLEGGFSGLWKQISGDLSNLWTLVLGSVTDYITKKVVQVGAEQLASLLAGPLGALWQALKTAWNIYCTIRDKIDQIKETLNAVFKSINDITKGNTSKAAGWVEQSLVKALGIAIDLLARILNIGDIPQQIKGFVEALQARVKKAIGGAMDWVLKKVKGLFKSGKDDKKQDAKPVKDESGVNNGRTVSQLQGATLATTMGAITIGFNKPSGNGHPPILNAKGGISGPLRGKGIPDLEKKAKSATKSAAQAKALESIKHAKGVAMGLENKGQRYLAGDKNKSEIKKAMDTLGAHMLEAANFVGGLNKSDKGLDILPAPYKFKAKDGEGHTVFVRRQGEKAQLTVASVEKPIVERLEGWKKDLKKLGKEDRKKAGGFIGKAIAMEKAADKLADDAAKNKDQAAADKAEAKIKEIAGVLGEVFALMEKPPQQWVPAIHDPFKHPNYEEFKLRATTKLNPSMSVGETEKLWKALLKAAGIASEAQAKEKAGTKASADKAAVLKAKAASQYKSIAKTMLAGRFDALVGKPYCLWSGGQITQQFASSKGYTALENTQAGALFDNLSLLSDNWNAEILLWNELSREFATQPVIGEIHCFQRWQGNVFSKVEKPTLEKRARKANALDKLKFKYHSIVGKESFSSQDLNKKYELSGPQKSTDLLDLGISDDESGWKAKLQAHDTKLETDNFKKSTKDILAQPGIKDGYGQMHASGQVHIKGAISSNKDKFQKVKTWDELKAQALEKSATVKKMVETPGSVGTDFGKYVIDTQAKKAVERANKNLMDATPSGQPKKDRLKTKSADKWARGAADEINASKVPFLRARQKIDLQLWDKNQTSAASRFLREGFEAELSTAGDSKLHDEFKPINYKVVKKPDGSQTITYDTPSGQSFTVQLDANGMLKTVQGTALRLKPDRLKGLRGYTASKSGRKTPGKTEQNASHIIADEFGGSGYKSGHNLITTSNHFNKTIMRQAEERMGVKIALKRGTQFTMDCSVKWAEYSDDAVAAKLLAQHGSKFADAKEVKDHLKKYHKKHALSKNLKRCKDVSYKVTISAGHNASEIGKTVKDKTGMDKWLGTE